MPTIKDVAERAGVAVPTVSRILNNKGYISEKTRDKVHQAMKDLDYQPNELARALYKKRSNLIGLIIPNVAHHPWGEFASCIEGFAYEGNYRVLLCNSYQNSQREEEYIDRMRRGQVDGIIMGGSLLDARICERLDCPVVTIEHKISENIPHIASDDFQVGTLAADFLIKKGCSHLALVKLHTDLGSNLELQGKTFEETVKEKPVNFIKIELAYETTTVSGAVKESEHQDVPVTYIERSR